MFYNIFFNVYFLKIFTNLRSFLLHGFAKLLKITNISNDKLLKSTI